MKLYTVKVPIVAVCYVDVEAESEKEAIQKALVSEDCTLKNVEEWEAFEKIIEGNVVYTYDYEACVVDEQEVSG